MKSSILNQGNSILFGRLRSLGDMMDEPNSSTLTPAMERMFAPANVFTGPDFWVGEGKLGGEGKSSAISVPMLRSMVEDALAKQMDKTAVFMAERLIHLNTATTGDIVLFARCHFQSGEYRRCLAFLEHRGLLSAEMLRSLVDIFASKMGDKENGGAGNSNAHIDLSTDAGVFESSTGGGIGTMGGDTCRRPRSNMVFNADTWMDRISAVQLAAHCLIALEEYDDCLVLLDPLISIEGDALPNVGDACGRLRVPTTNEDKLVERAKSIFTAVSRSWQKSSENSKLCAPAHEGRGSTTINVIAGLYATAGRCLDILDNRPRAIQAFTMAIRIDAACTEVVDYIVSRSLLSAAERRQLLDIVVTDQFTAPASSSGVSSTRQWLLPYYRFMLGGASPESAMRSMHRSTDDQLNDSMAHDCGDDDDDDDGGRDVNGMDRGDNERFVNATAEESRLAGQLMDVALGEGSAWLVRRAEYAFDRQLTEDAYRLSRAAYTIDPFDMRGLLVYIASMVELKLKTELFYLGHELVNTYSKQAVSWYAVGCYYWVCEKFEAAQKYLQKATKLDRRMHNAWVALGHVLAAQEESEHAISAYRAACRLVPGDHRPLCYMGKELIRTNNISLGMHLLLLSLTICPNDPAVRNELGVAYMRQENLNEAMVHLKVAAVAVYSRGRSLLFEGGMAEQGTNSASKPLRPKTPESASQMSNGSVPSSSSSQRTAQQRSALDVEDSWGDAGTSAQYAGRVTGIGGNDEAMSNYATCLRRLGLYKDALVWYDRCLALDPGCADTHAHIGFTLHLSGSFDEAVDSYHRALTLQPNNVFCADMLTRALSDMNTFEATPLQAV